MLAVIDIETEGLVDPQKLWCVVVREIETGTVHAFRNLHDQDNADWRTGDGPWRSYGRAALASLASQVSCWVGHNLIGFDLPVLRRLLPGCSIFFGNDRAVDTLVCSRLFAGNLAGGHSLESWGERLGFPKIHFKDFSSYSDEMLEYCIQDTYVTLKIYNRFSQYLKSDTWKKSLRLEHDVASICREMHDNGFHFDFEGATKLHQEITLKLDCLDLELQAAFPPRSTLIREVTPKATRFGTISKVDFRWLASPDLSAFTVGAPFSLVSFEPFNAGSPKQIVERLNEAGWKPFEKTKGHVEAERARSQAARTGQAVAAKRGIKKFTVEEWDEKLKHYAVYGWTISEDNLTTLPEDAPDAARKLVERLLLASRKSTLEEWFNAYNATSGRIHGSFIHIGAWTGRMSHRGPNMANIPAGESLYAHEMRSFWNVPKGRLLVGVDADAIQLRILAHYMDDERFTQALIAGNKDDGTDAHTLNMLALGPVCKSRAIAKRFIYAWLLGAGTAKVAQILGCSLKEAQDACANFLEAYPGLKRLKEKTIPEDASRGYFRGLDNRLVLCDNEHLMLAGYLQNGESVVLKRANVLWRSELISKKIPFWQVNFVHDEYQTETIDDLDTAKLIASVQSESIRTVGIELKLNCPLAGSYVNDNRELTIGANWSLTH